MSEVLELQINRPAVIALAYSDGRELKPTLNPDGTPRAPQVMFTLTDGKVMFVPASFAAAMREAGITAKTPFEILKAEIAKGRTQLQFRSLSGAGAALTAPVPPTNAPANYTSPDHSVPQAPAPGEALAPMAARFSAADMVAIDTLIAAREYAQRKGLALEIRCEDVRARAATIMIEQAKGGRA